MSHVCFSSVDFTSADIASIHSDDSGPDNACLIGTSAKSAYSATFSGPEKVAYNFFGLPGFLVRSFFGLPRVRPGLRGVGPSSGELGRAFFHILSWRIGVYMFFVLVSRLIQFDVKISITIPDIVLRDQGFP